MADAASPSAGVHLSATHLPPSFLPSALAKPSNLSLSLSPTSASPHQQPSTSSPSSAYSPNLSASTSSLVPRARSSSVQLPTTHQVLTPHSKPLTLTSPPTPTAIPHPATPTATFPQTADLGQLQPEDRFVAVAVDAHSPVLADDLFRLLSALYLPFFLQPSTTLPSLTAQSLTVTTITGGITNTLYRVTLSADAPHTLPAVLVRIFGPSTDQVIDRLTETRLVCELSRSRAGVRIYGHFTNGRLEEWLYATPLTPSTMTQYGVHIAATLATLHTQHIDWLADRPSPLYTTLVQWMGAASRLTWDDEAEADKKRLVADIGVEWWAAELSATLQLLKHSRWSTDQLVFCHNDLLSGNILLQQQPTAPTVRTDGQDGGTGPEASGTGTHVFLVDYEYSGNNYAAFDMANHFCECCGFECDWSQLPSQPQRLTFIRAYITARRSLRTAAAGGSDGGSGTAEVDGDVESEAVELERKVRGFLVLSHLWWGIWAIVQAKYSTIDFDYLQYSMLRKEGYLLMKDESYRLLKESGEP